MLIDVVFLISGDDIGSAAAALPFFGAVGDPPG